MVNQLALPPTNAAPSGFLPQPTTSPYATGTPLEGPLSAFLFLTLPAGQTSGQVSVNISQFGMSMVQSVLVDNEANEVGISITAGTAALKFGIQPGGTQIIPVFQTGVNLTISVTIDDAQTEPIALAFQIFNTYVPPASWVANLTVNGVVDIENVTGGVNVEVTNATLIGVGIAAEVTGGASSSLQTALTATPVQIKMAAGQGTFKGFNGLSAAAGWLQFFDAPTPGDVSLGTTSPNWSFPVEAAILSEPNLPPEGLAFQNGLQAAFTGQINDNSAPGSNWQGNIFFA